MIKKTNFIFNVVCMAERGACLYEPSVKVGRIEVWKKVGGTNVSFFFFFLLICSLE